MSEQWPVSAIQVDTGNVILKYPDDDELAALAILARDDIHPEEIRPFPIAGWIPEPKSDRARSLLRYHWRSRADWSPEMWNLVLVAVVGGEVVGTQAIGGMSFAVTRAVTTGSWLHPAYQGKGFGTEVRLAALCLAFEHIEALVANTKAVKPLASTSRAQADATLLA